MEAKFTQGPPELTINAGEATITLVKDTYIKVPKNLETQLALSGRVKEYGIKFKSQTRGRG